MRRRALLQTAGAIAIGMTLPSTAHAASPLALVGGKLLRHDKEPLEGAVIVVEGGTIRYAGTDDARARGAERIDANGKVITAGLVDVLTQIGTHEVSLEHTTRDDSDEPDEPDPIRAAFATADGYNPASSLVAVTRREGVTSVGVVPVGGLVAGQSAWADLDGTTPDQALARRSLALHVYLEDGQYGGFGKSRGAAMLRLRELFDDAKSYRANRGAYEKSMLRAHGVSRLDLEVIVRALDKKLPVVFHVDRASDILNVLAFAKAQGVLAVLASAAEGWKVATEIAKSGIPVAVYPLDHGPRSFAALGAREDNAALLVRAGVTLALSTGESHNARKLRQVAGNAVRAGLAHRAALAAITESPARMMAMTEHGAIAEGRVANLVVWTGDPLELSSIAETVIVRGRRVELDSRQTALLARYR